MSSNKRNALLIPVVFWIAACASFRHSNPVVMMTDFGTKDGAVSAMKGVAAGVEPSLVVTDLTHDITPYDIWEAAYRLQQTYRFWPQGTVFVTVVDPGVGSTRRSLVAQTKSGHFLVGPDNGLFTLVGDESGWNEVHVIKEAAYRRKGSEESYTFHGRDLYAYVGAQLAAGQLNFSGVGESIAPTTLVRLPYQKAEFSSGVLKGNVPVLDPNYGNVWTNIPRSLLLNSFPKARKFKIRIDYKAKRVFEGILPLVDTFSGVAHGTPLLYFNNMLNLSVALNMANFAKTYHVSSGPDWTITVSPAK